MRQERRVYIIRKAINRKLFAFLQAFAINAIRYHVNTSHFRQSFQQKKVIIQPQSSSLLCTSYPISMQMHCPLTTRITHSYTTFLSVNVNVRPTEVSSLTPFCIFRKWGMGDVPSDIWTPVLPSVLKGACLVFLGLLRIHKKLH